MSDGKDLLKAQLTNKVDDYIQFELQRRQLARAYYTPEPGEPISGYADKAMVLMCKVPEDDSFIDDSGSPN